MGLTSGEVERAFIHACLAELAACKPGNVHVHAPGHGMTVEDFRQSAYAAAPHIAAEGASVGERVLNAATASLTATGQNTNLGIVLLCAPLAHAALTASATLTQNLLRQELRRTLDRLDRGDAERIFAAIVLVNPGGLGDYGEEDVRRRPQISVQQAMALAAGRDRIAAAYVNGFADIFDFGLPALESALQTFPSLEEATSALFLAFLGEWPDTHISRKFGQEPAQAVQREARSVRSDFHSVREEDRLPLLLDFDRSLKERGLNPGTTADFTVATLFVHALMNPPAPAPSGP